MTHLETWRAGTWTGAAFPAPVPDASADVTTWTYHPWLREPSTKTYMAGTGEAATRRTVTYLYHPNGSLASREWQRTPDGSGSGAGVATSYLYDSYGRLSTVNYPDAATTMATLTPDVSYTYDSAGRVDTRTDGAGVTTHTWTAWGRASKESLLTSPSLPGIAQVTAEVERTFDGFSRPDLLKAKWGAGAGMTAPNVDYGFDANGYLNSVVSASRTISITPVSGAVQWGSMTFKTNTSTLMTATRTLDTAGRTGYVGYTSSGSSVFQSFHYTYDLDRVDKLVREQGYPQDEAAWDYDYDDKGQVISADKRFHSAGNYSGNYLAGHQTGYTYDHAGNRLTKKEGGDASTTHDAGTRQTGYTPNALNQYTTINNPKENIGGVDKQRFEVMGRRTTGSGGGAETIVINSANASYQADPATGLQYWRRVDHPAPTGADPPNLGTYANVTVTRTTPAPSVTLESGLQFLPHPTESPSYDADGNLRLDTRWTYSWDAENRLTQLLTRHTPSASVPAVLVSFGYDGLSRRLWKKTRTATNPAAYGDLTPGSPFWTTLNHETYLYDGWNLLMRVTLDSGGVASARQSYVWGPDLASTPDGHSSWQSAGGIGGLLLVLDTTGNTGSGNNFFPLADRMGNITAYRRANQFSPIRLSAVLEYDAFGRELKSLGEVLSTTTVFNPDTLPFRFSSKFTDTESGLLYYGYRYYDPQPGRWCSRDPKGELASRNLYDFIASNTLCYFDNLGQEKDLPKECTSPVNDDIEEEHVWHGGFLHGSF